MFQSCQLGELIVLIRQVGTKGLRVAATAGEKKREAFSGNQSPPGPSGWNNASGWPCYPSSPRLEFIPHEVIIKKRYTVKESVRQNEIVIIFSTRHEGNHFMSLVYVTFFLLLCTVIKNRVYPLAKLNTFQEKRER